MQSSTSRFGAKTLVLAAGILAAIGVSAFAISNPFSNSTTVAATTSSAVSNPIAQRVTAADSRLAHAFAIFRGARRSADDLPARIAARFDSDEFGSAPTLSRRAAAVDANTTVFAVLCRTFV